jgi:hypothetical protein
MAKLEEHVAFDLKEKIRFLSREAAIQILLGVVSELLHRPSLKAVDFTEYVEEGKKYMQRMSERVS